MIHKNVNIKNCKANYTFEINKNIIFPEFVFRNGESCNERFGSLFFCSEIIAGSNEIVDVLMSGRSMYKYIHIHDMRLELHQITLDRV